MTPALKIFSIQRRVHTYTSRHGNVIFLSMIENPCTPTETNSSYLFAFATLLTNCFKCVIKHPHNFIDRMSTEPRINFEQEQPVAYKRITFVHIRENHSKSLLCQKIATCLSTSFMNAKNITYSYNSQICVFWSNSVYFNLFSIQSPSLHLSFRIGVVRGSSPVRAFWAAGQLIGSV